MKFRGATGHVREVIYICMCLIYVYMHIHIYTYMYMQICIHVYVYVYMDINRKETLQTLVVSRGSGQPIVCDTIRDNSTLYKYIYVYVCICVSAYVYIYSASQYICIQSAT